MSVDDVMPQGVLDPDALPLFLRTARRIGEELVAARAQPGDRLPSERALAERYGVSRDTLRAALTEMQKRGVVDAQPGRGWFLLARKDPPPTRQVPGFADFARASGLTPRSRVLSSQVRPATVTEAETLRIAPGSELFELHRLRYLDGLLIAAEHNRLPMSLCPQLADTDFDEASLYATLRGATPPQVPVVADYSVEARPPNDGEASLLEIDASVPLLVATQLTYNQNERPLELTIATYRGDRYRFRASISSR